MTDINVAIKKLVAYGLATGLIAKEDIPELARRLLLFQKDHPLD